MTTLRNSTVALALAGGMALAGTSAQAGSSDHLAAVLESQSEEVQARYAYRHPQETLDFFGIKPGMTVLEALPGGGWYTRILMPYLGSDGHLIGADYASDMFPLFGFFNDEQLEEKKTWVEDWTAEVEEARDDGDATVSAFQLGSMPNDMAGSADAALLIRATHNLARFQSQGEYLTKALADVNRVLKPGGIVGVVQHHATASMPDEQTDGSFGYLRKEFVVDQMEQAGFELIGEIDINANPKDQPGPEEFVWRLPPALFTSREDAELKAKYEAIGESNRMTLKFRKVR